MWYVSSSSVTVRENGMSNEVPICIGKVGETMPDNDGNVRTPVLHWYRTYRQTYWMSGGYHPCFKSGNAMAQIHTP